MADAVEAIYCPGWTPSFGGSKNPVPCGGRRSNANLLAKTERYKTWIDPETNVHHSELLAEPTYPDMCSRCRKQKTKWDQEHGEAEARRAREGEQYEELIALYITDLGPIGLGLLSVVDAVEQLEGRDLRPPYLKFSERYQYTSRAEKVNDGQRWAILRVLAGLPAREGR